MPHHQLYKYEAIELSEDITFLLMLPPPEQVCTPPGSSDHFASLSDFVALPINTFEISKYASSICNYLAVLSQCITNTSCLVGCILKLVSSVCMSRIFFMTVFRV